ncbi:MAG: hypothetical protein KDD39_02630 [Bdellovibrionales bacterium]|nr:hypothetical protein [Bdellovibrionales bacterium]
MKPWTLIDKTITPDGDQMTLSERDGEYTIRVNGLELMATRRYSSEEQLAEIVCEKLKTKTPRILIGGLGFGFTLKAALRALPTTKLIVVAELLEAVISWNQEPSYGLAHEALEHPRVTVLHADVKEVIKRYPNGFDAILLDVDNGPTAFTVKDNDHLYSPQGLEAILKCLKRDGIAAFWSSTKDPVFLKRLAATGMEYSVHASHACGKKGPLHQIYLLHKSPQNWS